MDEQRRTVDSLGDPIGQIGNDVEPVGWRPQQDQVGAAGELGQRRHEILGGSDQVVPRNGERRAQALVVFMDRLGLGGRSVRGDQVNEADRGILVSGDVIGHADLDRVVRPPGTEHRDRVDRVDRTVAEEHRVTDEVLAEPLEISRHIACGPHLLR